MNRITTEVKLDIQAGTMTIDKSMVNEVFVPDHIKVHKDKKTGARTMPLPVRLPDGTPAVVMLTRLEDKEWQPHKEIEKIVIHFK